MRDAPGLPLGVQSGKAGAMSRTGAHRSPNGEFVLTIPIRAAAEPPPQEDAPLTGGSGLTAIDLFCGIGGFHSALY